MEKLAAVILAAGKGTRMGSQSGSEIPKVMFEMGGMPIIRHSVNNLQKAGIERITLVVGYKREIVMDYFKEEVDYAFQEEQLGTGHAVQSARSDLLGKSEAVLVCYGDMPLYKPETIEKLITLYQEKNPTIAMLSVEFGDPCYWVYGRIIRDEKGNMTGITEQKDCSEEQLKVKECNPGFYIFNAAWLWENIVKLKSENVQKEYYLTDLVEMAKGQNKEILAIPVSEEWEALGINTQEQLEQAEQRLIVRVGNGNI